MYCKNIFFSDTSSRHQTLDDFYDKNKWRIAIAINIIAVAMLATGTIYLSASTPDAFTAIKYTLPGIFLEISCFLLILNAGISTQVFRKIHESQEQQLLNAAQ